MRLHFNNYLSDLFPSRPGIDRAPNSIIHIMGVGGLVLYVLLLPVYHDGARAGETLMVLAFILSWRLVLPAFRREPLALLCLLWIGYLLFSAAVSPVPMGVLLDEIRNMSRLFMFLIIAWWVGGMRQGALQLYSLALAGLLLAIAFNLDWQTVTQIFNASKRLDFGIVNPLHFGLMCSIGLLGILIFYREILGLDQTGFGTWRAYARLALWLCLLLVLIQGIVSSQGRGIWVALAITLVLCAPLFILLLMRERLRYGPVKVIVGTAMILVIGAGLVMSQWEVIESRFEDEQGAIAAMFNEREDDVPLTSLGVRVHLWEWGVEKWRERPWLGWGARSTHYLLEHSDLSPRLKTVTGVHVHNTYLELLITTGIIGVMILVAAAYCLVRGIVSLRSQRSLIGKIGLFSFAGLLCFALASMTNVYINSRTGMYLMGLLGGAIYSVMLYEHRRRHSPDLAERPVSAPAPAPE
jgi:O-antigen ligase